MKPIAFLPLQLVDDNPTFIRKATSFQDKHDDINMTGGGVKVLRHEQDPRLRVHYSAALKKQLAAGCLQNFAGKVVSTKSGLQET